MAFALYPLTALGIIERWFLRVQSLEAQEPGSRTITPRELLLSAVALAYGYLHCEPDQDFLTSAHIVAALRSILAVESHPFVRRNALIATGLQGLHDFENVAPTLMELISEVSLLDRMNVVSVFSRVYLKQREQLTGGDGEIEVEGRTYPVWRRERRPLTAIEGSLNSWLRDPGDPVARQVTAQTFAALAATELEKQERSLGDLQEPAPAAAAVPAKRWAAKSARLHWLPLFGHAAVFLAAPLQRSLRSLLRPLLAEVIQLEPPTNLAPLEWRKSAPSPVLERLKGSDDHEVEKLACAATKAYSYFRWRWAALFALIFLGVLSMEWRAWAWSGRVQATPEDMVALQQRRAIPLRMARNAFLTELRLENERRLAALEAPAARVPIARAGAAGT